MRAAGRFLLAIFVVGLSFVFVALVFAEGSRQFITIWLPFALAALVGVVLGVSPAAKEFRSLLWSGIGAGAVLMWMLSEPEVSFHDHRELRWVALMLALACLGVAASLLIRWMKLGDRSYWWACGLLCMSWLIAFFSSPSGSSGGMMAFAMHALGLSLDQAQLLVFCARKSVHLGFYGLLGWTGFRWALSLDAGLRRAIAVGLLIVLVHASFDEGRQSFFPDRTSSFADVVLDMCGATIFLCMSGLRMTSRLAREAVTQE